MWYRPMGVVNDWKSKKHNKQGNWHPDDGCLFFYAQVVRNFTSSEVGYESNERKGI